MGLTVSQEELESCPQLPVCVNTDDQGIFSTYLENEYALLAVALEKKKDENGRNKYNRTMIYQWIDNLRQQGLNLSFSNSQTGMGQSRRATENQGRATGKTQADVQAKGGGDFFSEDSF